MRRVLITGGAGMIGRRVATVLQERGSEVAVLDNLSSGLPMPAGLARAVVGDIRDGERLTALCRSFRPEGLIHLAAVHHIPTCEAQRAYCLDVNITGTETVLAAAEAAGIGQVVMASSGAVYAWEDGPLDEASSATGACDNYALSKLSNETQLRFWSERSGGRGRVARLFNTIAADDPNAHLIPELLAQMGGRQAGETVVRVGNLSPRRDYLHAEDCARGLVAVLDDPRTACSFDTFNLCSGVEYSVLQLVERIAGLLGCSIRVEVDEGRKRRIDRPSQWGNPAKARTVLGWQVRGDLDEALRRTLQGG